MGPPQVGGAIRTVVSTMEEASLLEAQPRFRVRLIIFFYLERFGIDRIWGGGEGS